MSGAADLAADTAVRELGPGRYAIDLPAHWDFLLPSGGVLMAAALRAAGATLAAPEQVLVSASTIFCTPVASGDLVAEVAILRRGPGASQVRVALRGVASPEAGLEVLATFARKRPGPDFLAAEFPAVAAPLACPDAGVEAIPQVARWPFFHQLDCRLADGPPIWERDWEAGPARYARWFRYRVPQRLADGTHDPLALPPVADTMPAAVIRHLGSSAPRYFAPSLDLTLHFVEATRAEWLLVTCYARRAWAGYATAETEIWSEDRRLVAYGTQTMMLRRIDRERP